MYQYFATLVRVIDGDTLVVSVDLGFKIKHQITCRLRGINCPEMSTDAGKTAKSFVERDIVPGQGLLIETYKTEKYGRYLADVWYKLPHLKIQPLTESTDITPDYLSQLTNLGISLFEAGLAKHYDGTGSVKATT